MNISEVKCFSLEKLKPRPKEPHDFPSRKLKLSDNRLKPINSIFPKKESSLKRQREISNHNFFSPSIFRLKEKSGELSSPFTSISNKSVIIIETPIIKAICLFPVLKPRANSRPKLRYFS